MDLKVGTIFLLSSMHIGIAKSSIVSTGVGDIIGETATVNIDKTDFHVDTFLGIPYAKAPVDNLRFSKPEPLDAIKSPFNATQYSSACWQFTQLPPEFDPEESEDCLYLNVFVPHRNDTTSKYAVLVYIHGGAFDWGSSYVFDGKYLSAYGGIIVVTFNYRLGFLAFLRTDNIHAPGNITLWDQRLVLQWVNKNIGSFNGDNEKVTLLGTSVGAISAHIHGLYPENNGLFQRLTCQGGSVTTMEFGMQSGNTKEMDYIVKSLGCNSNSTSYTLDCLRKIPAENLTSDVKKYSLEVRTIMVRDILYVPSIDGTLINWDPRNITREDDTKVAQSLELFKSLDFLNGFSKYEAGGMFQRLLKLVDAEQFRPSHEDMEKIVEAALRIPDNKTFSDLVYNFITSEYTYWEDPINPEKIRIQVVKLYSDMLRAIPSIQMSRIHGSSPSSSPNNFMFLMRGKPSLNVLPTPSWLDGANHADELLFLSAFLERFPFAQRWEKELTLTMLTYWSNFVKTGDPNGEETGNDALPYWPRYELKKQEYIDLDRNVTARSYFKMKAANFWLNLLPELMKQQKTDECPDCPTCTTSTAPPAVQLHALNMRLFVLVSISLMTACTSFAC